MAVLDAGTATKAITEAAGGGSEILKMITAATELGKAWSPLIQMIANRLPNQSNQSTIQQVPITEQAPQLQQAPAAAPPQPAPAKIDEQAFMAFLATPEGRERVAAGLEQIKTLSGEDLKISQMIEILRTGNNPIKPAEAKKP
jgi:hypothetical protein